MIYRSKKLQGANYDIRGPLAREAQRLEAEGHDIIKLNIGNPAPFGFKAPQELITDVMTNLTAGQGYCESKGIFSARKAVMQDFQKKGIAGVTTDHVFIGNGVSELILMTTQGLLNSGDEVLIPSPDYPLWTAAVIIAGGKPVFYTCDEGSEWQPDLKDIQAKVTDKTKAIVVINPNNPTGAVYSKEILEGIVRVAQENNLVVMSDEIYDKVIFQPHVHIPTASLAEDVFFLTFGGLSKSYRAAGYRCGWVVVSGDVQAAEDYLQGLETLASMRLCSNVPVQYAVQSALGGYQSINDLVKPGGRLYEQSILAHSLIVQLPGVTCVKPKGAMYLFPKLDPKIYKIESDEQFALQLLRQKKVLVVHGSGFNMNDQNHFRIVTLPEERVLEEAILRIGEWLFSSTSIANIEKTNKKASKLKDLPPKSIN